MLGELDGLLLERVGPEHVGGRVDEVASEGDRRGDALDPRRVDPVGRDEPGLRRRVGLEAVVAVEREQEAERGEIGVARRIGEAIDAFGQRRRELAGGERIARRRVRPVDPEQDAGERARLRPEEAAVRPAFGLKPQRSAKAAAAAPIVDLTVGQFSALTSQTGVASGVGEANASKGSVSIGRATAEAA